MPSISLRRLIVLLSALGIHYSLLWVVSQKAPCFPALQAELTGDFIPDGHFRWENSKREEHLRTWGSWAGNDDHHGRLTFGPFLLPPRWSILVSGNPGHTNNKLYLQDSSGETLRLAIVDVGPEWARIEVSSPGDWIGREVRLLAQDEATGAGGWIGVSEPYQSVFSAAFSAYIKALTSGGIICLIFWGWHKRLLPIVQLIPGLMASLAVLLTFASILLIGYLTVITYFISPESGRIISSLFLLSGAVVFVLNDRPSHSKRDLDEAKMLLGAAASVFLFYLSVTYLYPWHGDLYTLAGDRFSTRLPSDNSLPHVVAERLFRGSDVTALLGDWQVSDRPPLQSGFLLLTLTMAAVLRVDLSLVSALTAILMQISWLPAVYGFLRALTLSPTSGLYCTFALSLSGFFIQNSVFTWPKLAAASLCAGAFLILVARPKDFFSTPLISMLLGLAWLTHGGVAFSFLALVPWLIQFIWRSNHRLKQVMVMVLLFVLTVLPWIIFQKVYDPPGDRLLKWHLAGQIESDSRGAFETIKDAYKHTPADELIKARMSNLRMQIGVGWKTMFSPEKAAAHKKKSDEFFFSARSLSWWLLGLPALTFAYSALQRQKHSREAVKMHLSLLSWSLLTYVAWISLMFLPGSAVIHQGSYVSLIVLFALLAAWLSLASPILIPIILALQVFTFMTTYFVSNDVVSGSPDGLVTVFMIASAGLCLIPIRMAKVMDHQLNPKIRL